MIALNATPRIGLALSGGGSRAIAFHLGSMKALHEYCLLDRISVLSTVSGGSVIGAMWAYSDDSFPQFEERVLQLLKRGLTRDIVFALFQPQQLILWVATLCIAHPINGLAAVMRTVCKPLAPPMRFLGFSASWLGQIQPPCCRWASRSTAFILALRLRCFGSLKLSDSRRKDIDIVINSCDLSSGTAFRFGTQSVGSWITGRMAPQNIDLATAVAASAAFPLLLPALDFRFLLHDGAGKERREQVLLTDGGVFDNLGISVFEPGREEWKSTIGFKLDYIICSSAGQGRPEERTFPYWFVPRLIGSTQIMFRKLQDAGLAALYSYKRAASIRGFALSYLAQSDTGIEVPEDNFISRSEVIRYPTNFSAMSDGDCNMLVLRGEQVMKHVLKTHVPELLNL